MKVSCETVCFLSCKISPQITHFINFVVEKPNGHYPNQAIIININCNRTATTKKKKEPKWQTDIVCLWVKRSKDTSPLKFAQLCPTLCNPMDCSPPGSSVRRIIPTRILDRVAISSSRGSSQRRDQTVLLCVSCMGSRFFTTESSGKPPPLQCIHAKNASLESNHDKTLGKSKLSDILQINWSVSLKKSVIKDKERLRICSRMKETKDTCQRNTTSNPGLNPGPKEHYWDNWLNTNEIWGTDNRTVSTLFSWFSWIDSG